MICLSTECPRWELMTTMCFVTSILTSKSKCNNTPWALSEEYWFDKLTTTTHNRHPRLYKHPPISISPFDMLRKRACTRLSSSQIPHPYWVDQEPWVWTRPALREGAVVAIILIQKGGTSLRNRHSTMYLRWPIQTQVVLVGNLHLLHNCCIMLL